MILLTGATGYLGRHLLQRLLERGEQVRCLVPPGEALDGLPTDRVELMRGDVTDAGSLEGACDGVDAVIHCAALMLPNPADRIRRINVEGTANVVATASRAQTRRFVYLSAVSAAYANMNTYGTSKRQAEGIVAQSGLDYTILRPTMIYGRGGGLHFQKLVALIRKAPGVLPVLGSGRALLQPVWVDDVVSAVEGVLHQPRSVNKTYGVSGASVLSFNEFVDRLAARLGVRRVKLHVPLGICLGAARALAPLVGASFFSADALRGINEDATLDFAPLQSDCGYTPLALDEGLQRALPIGRAAGA